MMENHNRYGQIQIGNKQLDYDPENPSAYLLFEKPTV